MNEHKQFEILCALAVVGQVSDPDLRELKQHLEACSDCQIRISDFAQISAQVLPLCGKRYDGLRTPRGMTARFLERACAVGIPVQAPGRIIPRGDLTFGLGWKEGLAAAVLVIAMIVGGISKSDRSKTQPVGTAAVKVGLRNYRSVSEEVSQDPAITQHLHILAVRRRPRIANPQFGKTGHAARLANSSGNDALWSPGIRSDDENKPDGQIFSNSARPELTTHDSSSIKPWLVLPWRVVSSEPSSLDRARSAGIDLRRRAMFTTVSLNSPFHLFPVSDRPAVGGLAWTQLDWHPRIDWGQIQRYTEISNSSDLPQYRRGLSLGGTFFGPKVEQQ